MKCFVTRLTTELLETSSLRIIDVQLLGERWEHTIVLFCFRFLSPIMTYFNRYFPSVMVNPLWDLFRRYISLKYSVKASNGTINNNGLLGLHSGLFATQLWLFYNAICIFEAVKNFEQFMIALLNAVFRESIIYYGSDIILYAFVYSKNMTVRTIT